MYSSPEEQQRYYPAIIKFISIVCLLIIGLWVYHKVTADPYAYPAKNLSQGWVTSNTWDCPEDHPIKGNLHSMIYHVPGGQYYNKTNGQNSLCFDTKSDATSKGFRASSR